MLAKSTELDHTGTVCGTGAGATAVLCYNYVCTSIHHLSFQSNTLGFCFSRLCVRTCVSLIFTCSKYECFYFYYVVELLLLSSKNRSATHHHLSL